MTSDFKKLGIIAGGGTIPKMLIEHCQKLNRPFFVLAIEGNADKALIDGSVPHLWIRIGQAGTGQQGLVLAVEGIEGTDELLRRSGGYKRKGAGGVLVKLRKPQQDMRIDLPTVGLQTVKRAKESGLRGIAVHAGNGLIVDEAEVVRLADKEGLFVIGVDPSDYAE